VHTIRGLAGALFLGLNTLACGTALLSLALVKLAIPANAVRKRLDPRLNAIAELWIRNNAILMRGTRWDVSGIEGLSRKRWYLVEANHQSWADILVLQNRLTGRIPLLKFFLKQELIRVPLIGLAWWALDFPFMKRHSPEFLRKHPERRGDDLAVIRRSCAKFALIPTSAMNFVEGTRFTPEKQRAQESPYRHLLRPKAGGIALALGAMGERFHAMLDVTIHYPGGAPTFFDLLSGNMKRVVVRVRELPIPEEFVGRDYTEDPQFKRAAQKWLGAIWAEKDELLEELREDRA
jgi:1-acyl-sn-glycerol-3-phosphate acyltransferase